MARYVFRESALEWLRGKGFSSSEIDELQRILNLVGLHKSMDDPLILVPKNASRRVAAVVHLLNSVTDAEGKPLCFEEEGFINIPEDAQRFYDKEAELRELEEAISKLQKVKFGRSHSAPKRRSSVKSERY